MDVRPPKNGRRRGRISKAERIRINEIVKQGRAKDKAMQKEAELPRRPQILAYLRCSHPKSAKSGLGIEVQEEQAREYSQELKGRYPELEGPSIYTDPAVSASAKRFLERRGARSLYTDCRPGDHVVFAKLDRGFRTVKDLLDMIDLWKRQEVRVHFLELRDLGLDSMLGEMMLTMLGFLAQIEARIDSERTRAVINHLKGKGKKWNGRLPIGTKVDRAGRVTWDRAVRATMGRIVKLYEDHDLNFSEISDLLEEEEARAENRKPKDRKEDGRKWSPFRVRKGYYREIEYQRRARDCGSEELGDVLQDPLV